MPFPPKKKGMQPVLSDPFAAVAGPKKTPKFKEMSAPGNRDFGLIGESAPAPMTATAPPRVPRLMGEMGLKTKAKKKGF